MSFSGGIAKATWIKATFTGTVNDGFETRSFSNWSFMILPYGINQTNPQGSTQTIPYYGIGYSPPIFGFSSFVGTGFSGQYNSWGVPYNTDEVSFTNDADSGFIFTTGRAQDPNYLDTDGTTTGITYTKSDGISSVPIDSISFFGNLSGFNPGGATSPDNTISGLIKAAMVPNTLQTVNCTGPGSCDGSLITNGEGTFSLTWSSVTFEAYTGVPAPLPLAGSGAFFYYSRRLRRRISRSQS